MKIHIIFIWYKVKISDGIAVILGDLNQGRWWEYKRCSANIPSPNSDRSFISLIESTGIVKSLCGGCMTKASLAWEIYFLIQFGPGFSRQMQFGTSTGGMVKQYHHDFKLEGNMQHIFNELYRGYAKHYFINKLGK